MVESLPGPQITRDVEDMIERLGAQLDLLEHYAAQGNGDAGRVYVDGRSPVGWHTGIGGGAWVALDRATTVSIGVSRSTEQTLVYARLGFPF